MILRFMVPLPPSNSILCWCRRKTMLKQSINYGSSFCCLGPSNRVHQCCRCVDTIKLTTIKRRQKPRSYSVLPLIVKSSCQCYSISQEPALADCPGAYYIPTSLTRLLLRSHTTPVCLAKDLHWAADNNFRQRLRSSAAHNLIVPRT